MMFRPDDASDLGKLLNGVLHRPPIIDPSIIGTRLSYGHCRHQCASGLDCLNVSSLLRRMRFSLLDGCPDLFCGLVHDIGKVRHSLNNFFISRYRPLFNTQCEQLCTTGSSASFTPSVCQNCSIALAITFGFGSLALNSRGIK